MNDITRAYFAGLFDGEGSVSIVKRLDPRYRADFGLLLRISIWNVDRGVLQEAVGLFGGSISTHKPRGLSKKTLYCWQLYGMNAQRFLSAILPYTRIARRKVRTALRYPIRRGGTGLTAQAMKRQTAIRERISSLNQK